MKYFDRAALAQVLGEGIAEMRLDVSPAQQEKLLDYLALMFKWNSVYNLTSLRDPMQ
ncbi:MAG: 16S rRNA (guanine(527)-N(7))-methyltransferase RsmG, partial [Massilia sp.]